MHERAVNLFCYAAPDWIDEFGSGFVIGPGLILTARHVVEIFEERYLVARQRGECAGPLEMYAVHAWLDPAATVTYRVKGWSLAPWTDLGILEVEPASDLPPNFQWRTIAIDLVPPRLGEAVAAFGFDRVEITRDEASIGVHARAVTSTGIMRELQAPVGQVNLRGWRFQTDARFDAGMSGGPVVRAATGGVTGVVSLSIRARDDNDEHVSSVALLWPLMGMTVHDPRPNRPSDRCSVHDLALAGVISAAGCDRVALTRSEEGVVTNIACPAEWTEQA